MATVVDYLSWRGDLSFVERPFNEVDALILATLSYLDFTGIAPSGDNAITLRDACEALLDQAAGDLAPYVRSLASIDESFLRALAASRRFGRLAMHDYVDVVDDACSLQFAALTVDLGACAPADAFVSFRGTDLTLTGWREDLMLSFEVTEAQERARAYLERILDQGHTVLVGGHSKGGNLAAFAVAAADERLLDGVVRAWSFDGPGMDPAVMARGPLDAIGSRFRRVQPAYSVVGQLFDRADTPRRHVVSSADAMMQHDPMTWQVDRDALVFADGLDPAARRLDDALAAWLSDLDLDQRATFTAELFDILGAGGATSLSDLTTPASLQRVAAAAAGASETTKSVVMGLVGAGVSSTTGSVAAAIGSAVQGAVHGAQHAAAGAAQAAGSVLRRGERDAASREAVHPEVDAAGQPTAQSTDETILIEDVTTDPSVEKGQPRAR